jgi:hypothetical protein
LDHLALSVPEWKIIADPEIVNELSNVIVAPISEEIRILYISSVKHVLADYFLLIKSNLNKPINQSI